jgi:hypothetical protein
LACIDVDSFYPSKERFALAMRLNNLLAAPGFSAWLEGEPLDIQAILHGASGKPRIAIFSIAHLGDAERMFFVSLLLNQVLGWMRQQPGTILSGRSSTWTKFSATSAHREPAKQIAPADIDEASPRPFGRRDGAGDTEPRSNIDYKGLGNAGTWVHRPTANGARQESACSTASKAPPRDKAKSSTVARWSRTLAGLGNRIFLMNNVHEDAPVVFESRWALSYLRGPLTRQQIKVLMDPIKRGPSLAVSQDANAGGAAKPQATIGSPAPISAPVARRATAAPSSVSASGSAA